MDYRDKRPPMSANQKHMFAKSIISVCIILGIGMVLTSMGIL